MDTKYLVRLIEIFCAETGRSRSYACVLAVKDSSLHARIKAGGGCTVKTYNRAVQWFSDHWPAGIDWPADIPRPEPARREDAA